MQGNLIAFTPGLALYFRIKGLIRRWVTPSVALSTMPRVEFASALGAIREPRRVCVICRVPGRDNERDVPMFGSLARLALVFAGLAFVIPDTSAHDSWISRGGHRNAAGEWCCGT